MVVGIIWAVVGIFRVVVVGGGVYILGGVRWW